MKNLIKIGKLTPPSTFWKFVREFSIVYLILIDRLKGTAKMFKELQVRKCLFLWFHCCCGFMLHKSAWGTRAFISISLTDLFLKIYLCNQNDQLHVFENFTSRPNGRLFTHLFLNVFDIMKKNCVVKMVSTRMISAFLIYNRRLKIKS